MVSLSTTAKVYSHVSCISLLHFKEVVNEDDVTIISFRVRDLKVKTTGVTALPSHEVPQRISEHWSYF